MVCGSRMYSPARVDVAVSVAAEAAFAPVMVLESANTKMLPELAAELAERVEAVRAVPKYSEVMVRTRQH